MFKHQIWIYCVQLASHLGEPLLIVPGSLPEATFMR